jgi:hypothetical protein
MTSYAAINLNSAAYRLDNPRPLADRVTLIAAARWRVNALRDAGLPTTNAEQALAKLEGEQPR